MNADITIFNLSVKEYEAVNPPDVDSGNNQAKITVEAAVRMEEEGQHIHIFLRVRIFIQQENMDLVSMGFIETETSFHLVEWSKYVKKVDGKNIVQSQMDALLISVSYDSTRGLLRERGKDDFIGKVILPVISPDEIGRVSKSDEIIN